MRRVLLVALIAGALIGWFMPAEAAPPPPRPEQPHPDQFEVAGFGNLAPLNPVNQKALRPEHTVSYRLAVLSGCSAGVIPEAMQRVEAEAFGKLKQFRLVRNDSVFDFTVYINCGSEQIRLCGGVNFFCLPWGYPYNVDVSISDVLSTYQSITQLSILIHEVLGHAIATWDEQYCKGIETTGLCRGLTQFTPAPGWRDVMNIGELSRHGLDAIELERWSRTMYDVLAPVDCSGDMDAYGNTWDPCIGRWVSPSGWTYDPNTRIWYRPDGIAEWGECKVQDNDCWNLRLAVWVFRGSLLFDPAAGLFSAPPLP